MVDLLLQENLFWKRGIAILIFNAGLVWKTVMPAFTMSVQVLDGKDAGWVRFEDRAQLDEVFVHLELPGHTKSVFEVAMDITDEDQNELSAIGFVKMTPIYAGKGFEGVAYLPKAYDICWKLLKYRNKYLFITEEGMVLVRGKIEPKAE